MTAGRESIAARIEYKAPPAVREVVEALGRTEDIRLSPDGRRLAIAGFLRNRLTLLDVAVESSTTGTDVTLTRVLDVSSPWLKLPHGVDFLDDETLIVVNREGGACVFELPRAHTDVQRVELSPIQVLDVGDAHSLETPGSVWVTGNGRAEKEVLICNNSASRVTRHRVDRVGGRIVAGGEVLLRKRLDIPDGVSVSHDGHWIAISNHGTHNVLMYEYSPSLGEHADPVGILRGVHYPHGVRFSPDDRHLFVADAGAPYIHVYARDDLGWGGVRSPLASVRIMDDAAFERGHENPEEGGPKGIEIDADMKLVAVTSECQPLAFFDAPAILEHAAMGAPVTGCDANATRPPARSDGGLDPRRRAHLREQQTLQVRYELEGMERAGRVRARVTSARPRCRPCRRVGHGV